jgi:hypothetical protein
MIDVLQDEFHVLNHAGTIFYIDKETRREIEHFLQHAERAWEALTVSDLAGMEVLILANGVNGIWSSTPEQRAADREMRKLLDSEEL